MPINLTGRFETSDFWRGVRNVGEPMLRRRGLGDWHVTFRPATSSDMGYMDLDPRDRRDPARVDGSAWTIHPDEGSRCVTVGVLAESVESMDAAEVIGGVIEALDQLRESGDDATADAAAASRSDDAGADDEEMD